MIESRPEGHLSSINYHLSTIIYQLSFIIYEQERTLAKNHPHRHHDTDGDSDYSGYNLVHRHNAVGVKKTAPLTMSGAVFYVRPQLD